MRDFFLNRGRLAVVGRLFNPGYGSQADCATAESEIAATAAGAAGAIGAAAAPVTQAATFITKPADSAAAKIATAAANATATGAKGAFDTGALTMEAAHEGSWGGKLRVAVDLDGQAQQYHAGDYLLLPARAEMGDVQWPSDAAGAPQAMFNVANNGTLTLAGGEQPRRRFMWLVDL